MKAGRSLTDEEEAEKTEKKERKSAKTEDLREPLLQRKMQLRARWEEDKKSGSRRGMTGEDDEEEEAGVAA